MEALPKPYTRVVYYDRSDIPSTTNQEYSSNYNYTGIVFINIGVDTFEIFGDVEVCMKEEYCECRFAEKVDDMRLELQMYENHREADS